jgi:hypothetical protein
MLQAPQEIAGLERRAWLAAELVGDEQLGALVPRPPEFGETVQAAVVERREIPRHQRSVAALHDPLINYMYLPAIPGVMPEGLALLYMPLTSTMTSSKAIEWRNSVSKRHAIFNSSSSASTRAGRRTAGRVRQGGV